MVKLLFATVYDGKKRYECGLEKWCADVKRLRRYLDIEVKVVSSLTVKFCEEATTITPEASLLALAANRTRPPGSKSITVAAFSKVNLWKWHLVSLVEYDTIFYSDLDVDLFMHTSPAVWANNLKYAERTFRKSRYRLYAHEDHASPINGGVFMIKPNVSDYLAGLRALRGPFNLSHGFEARPHALVKGDKYDRRTKWFRQDTWDIVGGNSDQGLLTYIYHVNQLVYRNRSQLVVHHFWGGQNPMRLRNCERYFAFTNASFRSRCMPRLDDTKKCKGVKVRL